MCGLVGMPGAVYLEAIPAGLAILAVEEVTHRRSASFVGLLQSLAFLGIHTRLRFGIRVLGFAAGGAAVGEAGLVGLQLKLFSADRACLDWKCHPPSMIQPMLRSQHA